MNGATNGPQPETQNPQTNINGNLQPNETYLQPSASNDVFNPQALPKVNSLSVEGTDSTKPIATQSQPTTQQNNNNPFVGPFVASTAILIIILVIIARIAKPAKPTEKHRGKVLKDQVINSSATNKPKHKKKARRKRSKKRK